MTDNQMTQILTYTLIFMIFILITLLVVFIYVKVKERKQRKREEIKTDENMPQETQSSNIATRGYNKQSITKFMEFDKIEDNMIVQKNGNRYLMVIECQGVNYDLMSAMEQTAVEEGFLQFLNSLRYPIQIYVQTRTVNLENSIAKYKKRVDDIESMLRRKEAEYESNKQSGLFDREEMKAQFYELTKIRNLYEYGKDIIYNTQQMSLNKNVLNKQYYIITSYYPSDLGNTNFDKEELKNIAFAELYTRCQAIISSLFSSGVTGKILDSNSLVELLYMAYNRDEAEVFGLDKAISAGYDELYSTAPEVIDKKIRALDAEIEAKAITKAEDTVAKVRTLRERKLEERRKKMDDIIDEMAKMIVKENEAYLGREVVQESIKELTKSRQERNEQEEIAKEKEEKRNVKKEKEAKKPRRTTKTA
ncbi:MAG: hypothetical protein HFJ50_09430 [Clostridia bacterium]|jgi:hypothetical protein|nr:hypothetical protein [Clostridia bacterium]